MKLDEFAHHADRLSLTSSAASLSTNLSNQIQPIEAPVITLKPTSLKSGFDVNAPEFIPDEFPGIQNATDDTITDVLSEINSLSLEDLPDESISTNPISDPWSLPVLPFRMSEVLIDEEPLMPVKAPVSWSYSKSKCSNFDIFGSNSSARDSSGLDVFRQLRKR